MRVVITGGAGFLGLTLARRLLSLGTLTGRDVAREEIERLVLFDAAVPERRPDGFDTRVEFVAGDIADRDTVRSLIDGDDTSVFHLASVVSGHGERDFDAALRVNLDGSRNVLDALRASPGTQRLVFASTLAVYGGEAMLETVSDATKQTPQTTYGATKAIVELLVNDYTRKGFLNGRIARIPTVIVRPGGPNAAASSFASGVFREPLDGRKCVLPVPLETRLCVIGYRTVAACLTGLHDLNGARIGGDRGVGLPGITVTVADMIGSLHRVAGDRPLGPIEVRPDPAITRIVETWPARTTADKALSLGLSADPDLDSIVRAYVEDFLPTAP